MTLPTAAKEMAEALRPFASIGLVKDTFPALEVDMIDAPDLCITARDVHRARSALARYEAGEKGEGNEQ